MADMTALEYLRAENWNALAPEALAKAVADAIEAVTPGVRVGATPEPDEQTKRYILGGPAYLARAALRAPEPLTERITAYLSSGGLFNPEMANHDAVRDLLIDCRAALEGGVSPQPLVNDSWATDWLTIGAEIHPLTANLVVRFARALAAKLAAAEKKYGYTDGWRRDDWMDECRAHLREHVEKGDPRDVAAYCAFLWHHGASTNVGEGGVSRTEPTTAWMIEMTAGPTPAWFSGVGFTSDSTQAIRFPSEKSAKAVFGAMRGKQDTAAIYRQGINPNPPFGLAADCYAITEHQWVSSRTEPALTSECLQLCSEHAHLKTFTWTAKAATVSRYRCPICEPQTEAESKS